MKTKKISIFAQITIIAVILVLLFLFKDYLIDSVFLSLFAVFSALLLVSIFNFIDHIYVKKGEMTKEKILEVVSKSRAKFQKFGYLPLEFEEKYHSTSVPDKDQDIRHCIWMLDQIEKQINDNDFEIGRINRWLGFVQHCLWAYGFYSLEEMRDQNRPTK
ncbi:MAG: hypothetical protein WC089_00595 [Candidatus Paceibacterota bacterium]